MMCPQCRKSVFRVNNPFQIKGVRRVHIKWFFLVFQEKESLKKENYNLKSKLRSAETTVTVLQSQLGLVRQQSVKFMLEQLERLNTCKETDV